MTVVLHIHHGRKGYNVKKKAGTKKKNPKKEVVGVKNNFKL